MSHGVIARSGATKQSTLSFRGEVDCFASLAMTGEIDLSFRDGPKDQTRNLEIPGSR
jgi:hypothetical protein